MSSVLRFAPSPNGRLHLGHAYSALLNDRISRDLGGRWLLRIEDIDPVRATPANLAGIAEDLAWLGLSWPEPVRRQSQHMDAYGAAGERLRAAGLLYPCRCSRSDIAAAIAVREAGAGEGWPCDPDGGPLYPGTCRTNRPRTGESVAWRIDMAALLARVGPVTWRSFVPGGGESVVEARPEMWGDVVLARKDAPTSYHLSVVLDDALQRITHVVRGRDLLAATDIHAALGQWFGLARPLYHHHDLVTGPDGRKLSKSRDSLSLAEMRAAGTTAEGIRARLGF